MTNSIIHIPYHSFLSLKELERIFAFPPMESLHTSDWYSKRKAWESNYDPKFQAKGGSVEVIKAPSVDSLPAKKWVLPASVKDTEFKNRTEHRTAMMAWVREQKFKYQICMVSVDNRERDVFLFKKESAALMFKLAWG